MPRDPAGTGLHCGPGSPPRSEVDAILPLVPRRAVVHATIQPCVDNFTTSCVRERSRAGRASPSSVLEDFAVRRSRRRREPRVGRQGGRYAHGAGVRRQPAELDESRRRRHPRGPRGATRRSRHRARCGARPRPCDPSLDLARHRQPSQAHAQGPLRARPRRDERVPGGPRGRTAVGHGPDRHGRSPRQHGRHIEADATVAARTPICESSTPRNVCP